MRNINPFRLGTQNCAGQESEEKEEEKERKNGRRRRPIGGEGI
jgi:hypothetical protein